MRPFVDTNILVYPWSDDEKAGRAQDILDRPFLTGVQVLNEFVTVLRRKLRLEWHEVEGAVADIVEVAAALLPIDLDTHIHALRLAERYQLQFHDAIVVGTALKGGCDTLLSEDMHDGLLVEGRLTIRNPFA